MRENSIPLVGQDSFRVTRSQGLEGARGVRDQKTSLL